MIYQYSKRYLKDKYEEPTEKFQWKFYDSNDKQLVKDIITGKKFPLNKLPASANNPGWLHLRLIDRPGNISRPIILPICISTTKKK